MGQGKSGRDGGGSVFVLLCILVLIVGMIAAAGMVLAVLNYTRESDAPININVESSGDANGGYGTSNGGTGGSDSDYSYRNNGIGDDLHHDTQIWSIATGTNGNNLVYIDRKNRQFKGYYIDVLNEVCQLAGKNCVIVHDDYRKCYFNDFPQEGLMGKWYDGCLRFAISANRVRSTNFVEPLAQAPRPVFLTRPGNPGGFNPDNLSGAKIGFLDGWWASGFCVFTLLDVELEDNQQVYYEFSEVGQVDLRLVNAVLDGEVDAAFVSNELPAALDGRLQVVRELEPCLLGGDSIMIRKDSRMATWWDPAFEKLLNSRTYRGICNDIEDPAVHGQWPGNTAENICFNL